MPGSGTGSARKRRENRLDVQKEIQTKAFNIVGALEDPDPPNVDNDPQSEDPEESDSRGVTVSPASSSVSAKENSVPRKKGRSSVNRNLIMSYSPKKRKRPSSASSASRDTIVKQGRRGRPPSSTRSSVVSDGRSTVSEPVVESTISSRDVEMRDDVSTTSSDRRSTSSSTLRASRRSSRVVREVFVEEEGGDHGCCGVQSSVVEEDNGKHELVNEDTEEDVIVEPPEEPVEKQENTKELEEGSDDHSESESGKEDSSDEENANEGVYVVERIDDKKVLEGITFYFIKWKGWHESSNTWEPIENLDGCTDLLNDFEKRCAEKRGKKRGGKGRKREHGDDVDKDISECQAHMKSYGVLPEWPTDKEPISVEGVLHVDDILTYVVKKKVRLGSKNLDRSNAVLVHANSFRIMYPQLVIDFYQSRVVWSENPKNLEEQNYVMSQMELIRKNVGDDGVRKLVGGNKVDESSDDDMQVVENRGDGNTKDDLEETDISSVVTSASECDGLLKDGVGGVGYDTDDEVRVVDE